MTDFSKFFLDKINVIRSNIQQHLHDDDDTLSVCEDMPSDIQYTLEEFAPTTEDELTKIIGKCPYKTCCLVQIPTQLLKKSVHLHLPHLVSMVNGSFNEGLFPSALRTAVVK